jgi:thiol-disulfide isomerase/thioredoxin
MLRYWLIPLVAVVLVAAGVVQAGGGKDKGDKDVRIESKLTNDDPKDKKRNAASKVHMVRMKAGKTYTIDMVSKEFDSYLRLEDKDGKELDEDDDSGGDLNARIIFNCTKDGEYRVICTAYAAQGIGNYVLTVKATGNVAKLVTSHESMVGKPAPAFTADFALNGKAKSLADLKGKVVLLEFWAVGSDQCAEAFPLLRDWDKKFRKDGLEVVGVTYYQSDIGHKHGFDAETGKLTKVDKADRASDKELLKAYAKYHQLDHLLLTLSKDDALKTFADYGVNGVPEAVLLDRQGNVRLVLVNMGKNSGGLEAEIKKLLDEK